MKVTLHNDYNPSPDDMAEEFWNSDAERQAEMLHSLAMIYKYDLANFCNQMFAVGEQFDDDERADVLSCLNVIVDNIEQV